MVGAGVALVTQDAVSAPEARPAGDRTMDDLLARVGATGDRPSFARLYAFFAPRVKGYLVRIGVSAAEAEDLVQEVMAKVWRKANLFDPAKASAATWIYTIARNQRIDAARRGARPPLDPGEPALTPDAPPRADVEIERRQRDARIRAVFASLPPNQQDVVALHFYEDHPHSAIAARLGLPLGTVKSRLRLAFSRIKRELGDLT